jgi:ubiquinone/menaquinone biosynthesis C-methylase UbiE
MRELVRGHYVCPVDHGALESGGDSLFCATCGQEYPLVHGQIVDLDVVKSSQRLVFDAHSQGKGVMDDAEQAAAASLANRFLCVLAGGNWWPLTQMTILDVACGKGELSLGLLYSPQVTDCDIFAFDHSVESLRVFSQTVDARPRGRNRLHLSAQDIDKLGYRAEGFDCIVGSAALHHFVNYDDVLRRCCEFLRTGGQAVFAEPFLHGYALVAQVFAAAKRMTGATENLGSLDFFVEDLRYRVCNRRNKGALGHLTDKMYFDEQLLQTVARAVGFSDVRCINYEPDDFYRESFIKNALDTYCVNEPRVRELATALYADAVSVLGDGFADAYAHFKFIVLSK